MLTISNISKAYAGRVLFKDVSLQVNRGDKLGLVGPNGAGKTTLFSIILGEASPDTGAVNLERRISMGYLPQETAPTGNQTALELAMAITPELEKLQRLLARPAEQIDEAEHHAALARFDELGGYQLEPRARRILADVAGAEALDSEAAASEARALTEFQAESADPRVDGGYWFGRKNGVWLPHVNPVSAAFATEALDLWERPAGAKEPGRPLI